MDGFRLAWTGTCTVGSALGFYRVPTCIQYNHSSIPSAPTTSDYLRVEKRRIYHVKYGSIYFYLFLLYMIDFP
jgi:hypothetical protein